MAARLASFCGFADSNRTLGEPGAFRRPGRSACRDSLREVRTPCAGFRDRGRPPRLPRPSVQEIYRGSDQGPEACGHRGPTPGPRHAAAAGTCRIQSRRFYAGRQRFFSAGDISGEQLSLERDGGVRRRSRCRGCSRDANRLYCGPRPVRSRNRPSLLRRRQLHCEQPDIDRAAPDPGQPRQHRGRVF